MGAFTSALAPLLGATRVPLNVVTVLLGLAGMALGGWLLWMSRFFTGPSRPARRVPAPPAAPPTAPPIAPTAPSGIATDAALVDDTSVT